MLTTIGEFINKLKAAGFTVDQDGVDELMPPGETCDIDSWPVADESTLWLALDNRVIVLLVGSRVVDNDVRFCGFMVIESWFTDRYEQGKICPSVAYEMVVKKLEGVR